MPRFLKHATQRTVPTVVGPRLAFAFGAPFLLLGVYLPFWPLWLESRGLSPQLIGIALGLAAWARMVINPVVGALADRTGHTKTIAVTLGVGVLVAFALFSGAHGTPTLLLLSVMLGVTFAPIIPLIDAIAVGATARGEVEYGRVRRWGSVAFIVGSVGIGQLLESAPLDAIVYTLCGCALVTAVVMLLLPARRRPQPTSPRMSIVDLLRQPVFRRLVLTCAALHGSHAVLYAYGTPHWRNAGIGESTIGALWAEGVVAEIALFSLLPRFFPRVTGPTMLVAAGIGGVLRWPALALTTSVPWLCAAQVLHGLTFAATHLGAMTLIREHIPRHATASATSTYASIATGLALGVGLPFAGVLYDAIGGRAYWAMAAVSAAGVGLGLTLRAVVAASENTKASAERVMPTTPSR